MRWLKRIWQRYWLKLEMYDFMFFRCFSDETMLAMMKSIRNEARRKGLLI